MRKKRAPVIPVTILTGFLGSGKTTLLNHILNDTSHGMKFAVIENEFGEVGIDEKVLSENVAEEMIEVLNGCICCTVRGDLVEALKKLYKKVELFNGIIIETTGLCDPAPVLQTFFVDEDLQKKYRLDAVITVVDAKHIQDRLNEKKPEGTENEAVEQIVFADKLLLNKIDLATDIELAQIEEKIKALNPLAVTNRTTFGKIHPSDILNIRAFDLKRILSFDPEFLEADSQANQHDSSVVSVACKINGEVNMEMLQNWITRLVSEDGTSLYRYKGVMAVKGMEEKFVFQGVGMLFTGDFVGRWKRKEVKESRFIFIGKNLDTEFLRSGFEACIVDKPLRFSIGDVVEANCGRWKQGTVEALWDDGNAYRILLSDRKKTEVYAPIDLDEYVRVVAH